MRTPESRDSSETKVAVGPISEAQHQALQRRQMLDMQQRSIRNIEPGQHLRRFRPPG